MARLWFLAVALVILLSAGNSLAGKNNKYQKKNKNQSKNVPNVTPMRIKAPAHTPMDPQRLANLVKDILNSYQPTFQGNPVMFAMGVSIPYNQKRHKFDLDQVSDDPATVRRTIEGCSVYTSKDMVAATVLKYERVDKQCPDAPVAWPELLRGCPNVRTWAEFQSPLCPADVRKRNLDDMRQKNDLVDHGEHRVLQNFDKLVKGRAKNGLMLFYSGGSPCSNKCANPGYKYNILNAIEGIKKWKDYAFVFSKPFKPPHVDNPQILQNNVRTALKNLGEKIDLSNIFRCDKNNAGKTVCESCSRNGEVSDFCVGA